MMMGSTCQPSSLLSFISPLPPSFLLSFSSDHAPPAALHPLMRLSSSWPPAELELAQPAAQARGDALAHPHGGAGLRRSLLGVFPPTASRTSAGTCTYNIYAVRRVQQWVLCVRSNDQAWLVAKRGFRSAASSMDERGNRRNVVECGEHEL